MKFRFKITDGESISFSDWVDEPQHLTGSNAMPAQAINDLRKAFPTAKFAIERDTVPPMPTAEQIAETQAKWMKSKGAI
jgi:hypothetical protein